MVTLKYITPNKPLVPQFKEFKTHEELANWVADHACTVLQIESNGVAALNRLFR